MLKRPRPATAHHLREQFVAEAMEFMHLNLDVGACGCRFPGRCDIPARVNLLMEAVDVLESGRSSKGARSFAVEPPA
jgi:hypothetical protein